MKIASPLTLNLTDTEHLKRGCISYGSLFFLLPHTSTFRQYQQKHLKQVAVRLKAFALILLAQAVVFAMFTTILPQQAHRL